MSVSLICASFVVEEYYFLRWWKGWEGRTGWTQFVKQLYKGISWLNELPRHTLPCTVALGITFQHKNWRENKYQTLKASPPNPIPGFFSLYSWRKKNVQPSCILVNSWIQVKICFFNYSSNQESHLK
jgi:hypothetical protein